jgi:hypothetical protein
MTENITARIHKEEQGVYVEIIQDFEMIDEFDAPSVKEAVFKAVKLGADFFGIFEQGGEEGDCLSSTMDLEEANAFIKEVAS